MIFMLGHIYYIADLPVTRLWLLTNKTDKIAVPYASLRILILLLSSFQHKRTCINISSTMWNIELIKFFHRKFHRFFHWLDVFCEKFTGVSFFCEKIYWLAIDSHFTRKIAPARQRILFCLKRKTRFLRNIHTMTIHRKHVEIIKF